MGRIAHIWMIDFSKILLSGTFQVAFDFAILALASYLRN